MVFPAERRPFCGVSLTSRAGWAGSQIAAAPAAPNQTGRCASRYKNAAIACRDTGSTGL
jgi:hypothetical protein